MARDLLTLGPRRARNRQRLLAERREHPRQKDGCETVCARLAGWDERYADLVIGKRNWQIAAGGLLLATIILLTGMVVLSSRTRYIVYAVEVDKLGYALTQAQPLTASSLPDVIDSHRTL